MASEEDIALAESDIKLRIKRWRNLQAAHMPHVKEAMLSQAPSEAEIEEDRLHLPSCFSADERQLMSLLDLAEEEKELRKAQVIECILQLRRSAKRLSAVRGLKKKDDRGQRAAGRVTSQRHSIEFSQECLLAIYSVGRLALISLDNEQSSFEKQFPTLTADDLFRKSTVQKRQMGDSHRAEGALWGVNSHGTYTPASLSLLAYPSTSQSQRLHHDPAQIIASQQLSEDASLSRSDSHIRGSLPSNENVGKLWDSVLGLSSEEVEIWELEGMSCHPIINIDIY